MNTSLVVVGSLITDIVASGLKDFPNTGAHVYGKQLAISPGGKSSNIAAMAACLMGKEKVAMVGRTTQDRYGLWKVPLDALNDADVNTDFVVIGVEGDKLPGIALISVDEEGNNQIVVLNGASDDFSVNDVDKAKPLFEEVARNSGYLVLTLECSLEIAKRAMHDAKTIGLKVIFDPGGIVEGLQLESLLEGSFLVKPNEHEAKILTGVTITDFASAERAARKIMGFGAENVLITMGVGGAYLFTASEQKYIPIPKLVENDIKDETGCGDQTIATLCACLQAGETLTAATEVAVLAGTLQFHKQGVQPITKRELEAARR